MNMNPQRSYIGLNRWNGGPGNDPNSYVGFPLSTVSGFVGNGDVMKATIVGSTITVWQNGTQIYQVTDSNITSGRPGVGFFNYNVSQHIDASNWGVTRFTAHTVGTPFPVGGLIPQPQSLRLVRQSRLSRTLGVAQVLSLPRAVTLTRALQVATSVVGAAGLVVSRTLSIAQAQVATLLTPQKVILRAVSATQSQTARLLKTVQLPRSVNVNQVLAFVRRLSLTRTLTQAESATVISRPTLGHIYALTGTCGVGQSATLTTHVTLILQVLWAATTDHFATSGTNPTTYWDPAARIFQTTGGKPPAKWTGAGGQFQYRIGEACPSFSIQ